MASKVVGDVNAMSLKFKWEINNFSSGCENVGDYLESPKFPAVNNSNDIQWHLKLYPQGKIELYKDFLSLYLYADPTIKAVANFKILNSCKVVTHSTNNTEEREYCSYGLGFNQFISRDLVMNPVNGILNDDKITIVCEITIVAHELKEVNEQQAAVLSRLAVLDTYEDLLDDSEFSDVSLVSSEGKIVKVNKRILAKNSSVFAAMFEAEMKEKQENSIEIADIRCDVLMEMARFVYAGKVNNIDTLVGELATAADKYALDGLKDMCEKTMTKNLSADNVIDCLQLADKLCMDKLKEQAIEFVVEKGSDVTDKPEFELLPSDIICKICRSTMKRYKE